MGLLLCTWGWLAALALTINCGGDIAVEGRLSEEAYIDVWLFQHAPGCTSLDVG